MKTTNKYVASLLAATAIGCSIGLAPIALAAPVTTSGPHSTTAPSTVTPPPYDTGTDPLVPSGVGAFPDVPAYPGQGRAF
jgi:hypothetical protein